MSGRHDGGGEHGVEILNLVLAAFAVGTVGAMDFVGAVEFRSIQSDQDVPVQAPHGVQAAALIQFRHEIGEHGVQHGWFDRVEPGPDLAVTGNFAHAEQCLAVGTALTGLQMPLVCQKRWALHEERREPGQGEIGHVISRVQTPPLIWQGPAATAKGIEKAVLEWHTPFESSFDAGWKPENRPDRGYFRNCCTSDSPREADRERSNTASPAAEGF
jgi:hypothetical protein